mmetsp:Transcript_21189/g.40465  ORF Transcript_21189/g.40465 Transcript_21189/m.40465 type:complete len:280 (-) Transcript_21189:178-1017(-)
MYAIASGPHVGTSKEFFASAQVLRQRVPASLATGKKKVHSNHRPRTAAQAGKDPNENLTDGFERSENQKLLANLDGAVRQSQKDLGKNLKSALKGPLSMLGMGGLEDDEGSNKKAPKQLWEKQYSFLKDRLTSIDSNELQDLLEKGWVFLDVRPYEDFEAYHPIGAVNVPVNQYIAGTSAKQLLRKSLFAMQAVKPIEANPDFDSMAKAAIGAAPGVVVACAAGGTLQSTTNFPSGQQSRSLIAAYKILQEGASGNVKHLKGGLNTWFRSDLPGEGVWR